MEETQQKNSNSIESRLEKIEVALNDQQRVMEGVSRDTGKIKKYIFWGRMLSLFYLLLVIAPIVLAILYLPPYVREFTRAYQEVLPARSGEGTSLQELQRLLQELKGP